MINIVIIQHVTKSTDPNIDELTVAFQHCNVDVFHQDWFTLSESYLKILKKYYRHKQPLLIIKDNSIVHYKVDYLDNLLKLNADLYSLSSYHLTCHALNFKDYLTLHVKAYEHPEVTCTQALLLSSPAQRTLYKALKVADVVDSLESIISSCQFNSLVFYPNLIGMDPLLATCMKDYEKLNYAWIIPHQIDETSSQIVWVLLMMLLIIFLVILVPYFKHYRGNGELI